jgi:hypothetical protein
MQTTNNRAGRQHFVTRAYRHLCIDQGKAVLLQLSNPHHCIGVDRHSSGERLGHEYDYPKRRIDRRWIAPLFKNTDDRLSILTSGHKIPH